MLFVVTVKNCHKILINQDDRLFTCNTHYVHLSKKPYSVAHFLDPSTLLLTTAQYFHVIVLYLLYSILSLMLSLNILTLIFV